MIKASVALAILSTATAFSAAASAADMHDLDYIGPSYTVKYYDLDTSKQSDMRQLYARITRAAKSVCLSAQGTDEVSPLAYKRKCIRAAIANAVAKVNRPLLTAIHNGELAKFAAAQ